MSPPYAFNVHCARWTVHLVAGFVLATVAALVLDYASLRWFGIRSG